MPKFKVIMVERQKDGSTRKLETNAVCDTRQEVIEWYGLNQPDIVSYHIELED